MEVAKAIKAAHASQKDFKCYMESKNKYDQIHISFRGADEEGFRDGIYHMKLDLTGYPLKAPHIMMLSESGGYRINSNICLVGITNDSSQWTPHTTLETIVSAIRAYMVPKNRINDGTAMIRAGQEEVCRFAVESKTFKCKCGADHSRFEEEFVKIEENTTTKQNAPKQPKAKKQFAVVFDANDTDL